MSKLIDQFRTDGRDVIVDDAAIDSMPVRVFYKCDGLEAFLKHFGALKCAESNEDFLRCHQFRSEIVSGRFTRNRILLD